MKPSVSELPAPLQAHPLVESGLARIVWSDRAPEKSPRQYIGILDHSSELQSTLRDGKLDGFLSELTTLYRDIYGYEPWNEYLRCTRQDCSQVVGVREACDPPLQAHVPLSEVEIQQTTSEQCPQCSEKSLELYYPPAELLDRLRAEFQSEIHAALLFGADGQVQGFAYGEMTNIHTAWREKLAPIFKRFLDERSYVVQLQENLGSNITIARILYLTEWGVTTPARNAKAALGLVRELFVHLLQKLGRDIPIISYSTPGEASHSFNMGSGGRNVCVATGSKQVVTCIPLQTAAENLEDMSAHRFSLLLRGRLSKSTSKK